MPDKINKLRRRTFVGGVAAATLATPGIVSAQGTYPNKPVRLVVPFAPGGSTDVIARMLGQKLSALWKQAPTFVVFYRGGWCPYCNLELRAWQQYLAALKQLGGQLVAVSPQTPDNSLSAAEKNELAFPVLSDSALEAATAFGVAFAMPPELIELYSRVGNDLPVLNGNGRWVLPVPATYVIDRNGRVAFAHVEADYRERAEPRDVLAAVAERRPAPADRQAG